MKIKFFAVSIACFAHIALAAEIHRMTADGDLEGVVAALGEQPELVNARDEKDRTPLHWACRAPNSSLVGALIASGADVNAVDQNLNTPLHSLAHRGYVTSMKVLLARGASVDAVNYEQNTPLHYAAAANQAAAVGHLVDAEANLELRDAYGRTALILAARERGGPAVAIVLLQAGANVNAIDTYGADALSLAAWRGKRAVVNLLLDAGARVPASGPSSQSLFEEAAAKGLTRLFETLLAAGGDPWFTLSDGGTILHAASAGGSLEILRTFADKDLDLDRQDHYGWTPLHYAARDGRTECAAWLLHNGARTDLRNAVGQTPFNVAEKWKAEPIVRVLRAVDANTSPCKFPPLEGDYIGQNPPSDSPEPFAIGIVSSIWGLHSSVSFAPDGRTALWAPMVAIPGQIYSQGGIMMSRRSGNGRWTPPEWAPFSDEIDGDVAFFAPDGSRVYFISTRPHPGAPGVTRERIWYADRHGETWLPAQPVDEAVNDLPQHWQFAVDGDHTIYFSTDLPTGRGGADLYRSSYIDGAWLKPIELGPVINSEHDESTPFIAPDASYLLFQRNGDLWLSFATPENDWTEPRKLPEPINSSSRELCPTVSPDGKYLFFISNRDGNRHVWWVTAEFIDRFRTADPTAATRRRTAHDGG